MHALAIVRRIHADVMKETPGWINTVKLTTGEVLGNWIHLVLQHFCMESCDVEWLDSVWQTASQHCIHVDTAVVK